MDTATTAMSIRLTQHRMLILMEMDTATTAMETQEMRAQQYQEIQLLTD